MRRAWFLEALFLAGLLFLAVVFMLIVGGSLAWWLLLGLLPFLFRHIRQLRKLECWLRTGRSRNPPDSWGIWGDVFDLYYQIQRRYYKRKKRLSRVIREFRESTAAMPDGTVVLDADWRIQWYNDAAVDVFKLSKRDLGQPITGLVRQTAFLDYLNRGDFEQALILSSPAIPNRMLSVRIVPYGKSQFLMLGRDVTRVRKLEAMRRDFVANASHELRSPLTVLNGYLESLTDEEGIPEDLRPPLQEMQHQCRRMAALVNDLLELSRLEIEESDAPGTNPVDIPALIDRVRLEAEAQNTGNRDITVDSEPMLWLKGSEPELHSAFLNLVINALRYTSEGGRIRIRWFCNAENEAVFEVEDDGEGIEARHLPFITQRFYRVDPSRSRAAGGSGLGLAIVKHVLQRHDGRLEIESEVGVGSRFRCVFGVARVTAPPIETVQIKAK